MHYREIAMKKLNYLDDWMKDYKALSALAPHVKHIYDLTKWENDVFSTIPSSSIEGCFGQNSSNYAESLNDLMVKLPLLPHIDVETSMTATSTSSAYNTYESLLDQKVNPDLAISSWALKHTLEYENILEINNTRNKVHEKLKLIDPEIADEFDLAEKCYASFIINVENQQAVGIALRNVLEGYKGRLFAKAKTPSEQKLKWNIIAERLSIEPIGSIGYQRLLCQGTTLDDLHKELTNIAKLNKIISVEDLREIHTRYINHLTTVLFLVRL